MGKINPIAELQEYIGDGLYNGDNGLSIVTCSTSIQALEKQVPKKAFEIRVKHDFNGNVILKDGYCPICNNELSNAYYFCNICGQRLDWGDTE